MSRTRIDRPAVASGPLPLGERLRLGDSVTLLIARVGAERFAFEVGTVHEAADAAILERVPQLPAGAVGLLRWHGAAHTVWSPNRALRVTLGAPSTVLFLRAGAASRVAMAVDDVEDLVTLAGSAVRGMTGVEDGEGLVLGVIQVGDSFATVLDTALLAAAVSGRAPANGEL